jgi:hypothetical protein
MPLLNLTTSGIESQLKRIADALERLSPPYDLPDGSGYRKRGPESIVTYGNDNRNHFTEEVLNYVHPMGLAPAQEQEILNDALKRADEMNIWEEQ